MITSAEIKDKIKVRAYKQFLRDFKKICEMVYQQGELSAYEVLDKVKAQEKKSKREEKLSKIPLLKKFIKAHQNMDDDHDFYDFVLRFMSNLGLNSLTAKDLSGVNVRVEYQKYKSEYEWKEEVMFRVLDLQYFNCEPNLIKCKQCEDSAENY